MQGLKYPHPMVLQRFGVSTFIFTYALSVFGGLIPARADNKLALKIDVSHSYLNGFKPGKIATLGDEWTVSVRVRDDEGDPAAGSEVRIYRGKKQIAFGRSSSKGIAKIQLPITKIGSNSLRVVAKDSNPTAIGEANLEFETVQPVLQTSAFSIPSGFYKDPQTTLGGDYVATNVPALIQIGCKRYWSIESYFWPFSEAEDIQKWGFTPLPRVDQSKIDTLLSDSYKGWAIGRMSDDGSAPLLICDIAGVLNLFNR